MFLFQLPFRQWDRDQSADNESEQPSATSNLPVSFEVFDALSPNIPGRNRGKALSRVRFLAMWKKRMSHVKVLLFNAICCVCL